MKKTILSTIIVSTFLSSIFLTSCSKQIEDKDPSVFYANYMKYRFDITPEEQAKFIYPPSLVDSNVSIEDVIASLKKTAEDLKFSGFKLDDVKVDKVIKYDEQTVILATTFKFKTSDKAEEQFSNDVVVLTKDGDGWKINFDNLIKHYRYADSCGSTGKISLCITDSYIYPIKTVLIGQVNNPTNDTYMFGFASPASTLIVLDDKSKINSNFPSVNSGQSHSDSNIEPGKSDIKFYFGTVMDPVLVKNKPVYFAINQLKKTAWGGMPSLRDKGQQIDVSLKESTK